MVNDEGANIDCAAGEVKKTPGYEHVVLVNCFGTGAADCSAGRAARAAKG